MDRHEYKRQNEERAARRETNLAQESQAQIEEQRAASLALYRTGWRYKVCFIKWRPAWWNTPSDRFAFFIALFTAVFAIVAYFQLAAMKHTDEAINEQLQEMRRQTATTRAQICANISATGLIAQAAIQNGNWCVLVIPNDTAHNMFSFLNLIQDIR